MNGSTMNYVKKEVGRNQIDLLNLSMIQMAVSNIGLRIIALLK
jgi:hypothetical protein